MRQVLVFKGQEGCGGMGAGQGKEFDVVAGRGDPQGKEG